jgi:site-specific DNA recombinase
MKGPTAGPRRVGIYTRLSRDTTNGRQTATGRQESDCRQYAAVKGWEIAEVYEDVDFSAYRRNVRRPAYERILQDVAAGVIDGVVVWKLDRLVRRAAEFERFWAVCEETGGSLAAVHDPIDTSSEVGMAIVRVLVAFAQLEAGTTSLRIRSQIAERVKNGRLTAYGGRRPFGFERDRVTVREPEAQLIREAADRILAGESMHGIARDWNGAGVTTTTGGRWHQSTLKRVLVSPRVGGFLESHGEIVGEAPWRSIIDRDKWERLRARIGQRDGSGRPTFGPRRHLLVGLAYCGNCGAKLTVLPPWGRRNSPTYVCPVKAQGGCGAVSMVAPPLETLIRDQVFKALDSPILSETLRSAAENERDRNLLQLLHDDEAALEQLAHDHYIDRIIDRRSFLSAKAALEGRIEDSRRQLARRTRAAILAEVPSRVTALREAWEDRDVTWRRALLDAMVERITVAKAEKLGRFDPSRVDILWAA